MNCIIAGCGKPCDNIFGVRLRYPPKKNAWWAPETNAYVCDAHAKQGIKVTVVLEETNTGNVETVISGVGTPAVVRTTPIN